MRHLEVSGGTSRRLGALPAAVAGVIAAAVLGAVGDTRSTAPGSGSTSTCYIDVGAVSGEGISDL